ncbi:hypothetical protein HPB52_005496 [Rhipicephalus sanguineus]|uniref:Endonuclease/exonuclease/phosphatase domain-containing protein n=1 Tax=Rhipicephalus sanguineus TaxID=34632 RepID=A0A9D4QHZ2_RHISA|nr:hypothetical protein HPB52_005496 [Rhipicephalus sanguineus]
MAVRAPLLVVGDFNAKHADCGYAIEDAKGRKLHNLMTIEGLTLLTDADYPTRIGNSISRDTCPDHTMTLNAPHLKWLNSQEALGNDHYLIHTTITYGDTAQLFQNLEDKYINTYVSADHVPDYSGLANPEMDRDFTAAETRAAIDMMRRGTAPVTPESKDIGGPLPTRSAAQKTYSGDLAPLQNPRIMCSIPTAARFNLIH